MLEKLRQRMEQQFPEGNIFLATTLVSLLATWAGLDVLSHDFALELPTTCQSLRLKASVRCNH